MSSHRPHRVETKTAQLCRQVKEAVTYALVCATSPILRELTVVVVEPVKGTAVLRVLVAIEQELEESSDARASLARAQGYVRAEVARAINRKRVPTLQFVIVPAPSID